MVVAIIQARMGSSRLPNKVMKEILGKPLIEYLLTSVSKTKLIDKIILATTTQKKDDPLVKHVQDLGYEVCRGSENDVLQRYYEAFNTIANKEEYNGIVRLTGDCPLLQPQLIDKVVRVFLDNNYDHVCLSPQYAEGLDTEIFKPKLLVEAYKNAIKASEREHVMLYISNNKDRFNMYQLPNKTDDSNYRITVDEPEDFQVVESIITTLQNENKDLSIENIKQFLDQNQNIHALNSAIIRNEGLLKSLANDKVVK